MKDKTRKFLLICFSIVAVLCFGYIIWYYYSAMQAEKSAEKAKQEAVAESIEPEVVESMESKEPEKVEIPIDFPALQETNPDVFAWIKVDGTIIDYPVVQSPDNDNFYLNHSWEGKSAVEGAIFTDSYNDKYFTDYNMVLYGHQMGANVETMFHQLDKYLDQQFMDEHHDIVIYTPDGIRTYRVFAAVVYDDRHVMNSFNFIMESERQAFIDSLYNSRDMRNKFCEDVSVTAKDRLLTLSTCIEGEPQHRLLIGAVLIDEK